MVDASRPLRALSGFEFRMGLPPTHRDESPFLATIDSKRVMRDFRRSVMGIISKVRLERLNACGAYRKCLPCISEGGTSLTSAHSKAINQPSRRTFVIVDGRCSNEGAFHVVDFDLPRQLL